VLGVSHLYVSVLQNKTERHLGGCRTPLGGGCRGCPCSLSVNLHRHFLRCTLLTHQRNTIRSTLPLRNKNLHLFSMASNPCASSNSQALFRMPLHTPEKRCDHQR